MSVKDQCVDLEAAVAGLCGDYSKLAPRLRVLSHNVRCNLPGVQLSVHYPAFRSGKPTDADLTDLIAHYISHFALPRTVRKRTYDKFSQLTPEEIELHCSKLRAEAVRTFIKAHQVTKRNGEAGELMLFLLTEWMLGAPQIIAKMSLKTNPDMPVYGSDGVHIKYDRIRKTLKFYFGESKIHSSLSSGLNSAASSIVKALSPSETTFELDLVERHIDQAGLPAEAVQALLEYLDPWHEVSNSRLEVITSLVAFDYSAYGLLEEPDPDGREREFETQLAADLADIVPRIAGIFQNAGIGAEEVELFLLPLPSVSVLRERFQALIGWKA